MAAIVKAALKKTTFDDRLAKWVTGKEGGEDFEVEWGEGENPPDSEAIAAVLAQSLNSPDGSALRDDGDVETAFTDGNTRMMFEPVTQAGQVVVAMFPGKIGV